MSAKLEFLSGKRKGDVFELEDSSEEFGIGNRKSAEIRVRDPWISYKHAKICLDGGQFFIEDLGSSNGTWVDGQRIERRALEPGMLLYLGKTKIKFLQERAAPAASPSKGGAPAAGQAWWDKVIEVGVSEGGEDAQPSAALMAQLKRLEAEASEERGMRRALERFLDVPEGSRLGDAAQAGALVREKAELEAKLKDLESGAGGTGGAAIETAVAEATERLRRDHMSQVVELEARAKQFESRAIDFEGRLKGKGESAKAELKRFKEGYEAELEQLRTSLEEARGASGAEAGSEQSAQLEKDLAEARTKLREQEESLRTLKSELEEARNASSGSDDDPDELKSQVWAAVEEATRWKELARQATDQLGLAQAEAQEARAKHDEVVQEIDEISMEQIEIEEELTAKVRLLKDLLAAASGRSPEEVEADLAEALAAEEDQPDEHESDESDEHESDESRH